MIRNNLAKWGYRQVETRTIESLADLSQFKELELYKDFDKRKNIQSIRKITSM